MLTCEKCGVSFEEPREVVEVTSLRVLCPACTAQRAAAKARTPGLPSAPPSARPAAAPPASRAIPAAAVRKGGAGDGAAPKVAPSRPAPSKPAPAPHTVSKSAPSKSAAAKVPAPAASREKAKKPAATPHADLEEIHRGLKKKGSRELIIAFAVSFVVFVAAGVTYWKVNAKKQAAAAEEQAYLDKVANFKATFLAFDIQTEPGATQLIAYAEEQKSLWEPMDDFAPDAVSRVAKANNFLDGLVQRRDLETRLTEIEQGIANAAQLAPIDLAELRRRLDELAAKAEIGGPEFVIRVASLREQAEKVYVERLVTSAQTAAAATPLDRAALATIQQSEDELFKLFEGSYKAWQKNAQDAALIARKDEYQEKYQGLVKLSDEAVQRFFTPEVIEATPWRDLLSADQASQWKSAVAKGYERRIENGVLHLIGPDPSEKSEIIMSIGDRDVWRDFEIDMEFTIEKGLFTTYFRAPLVYQENIYYFDLKTEEGFLEVGRPYTYSFRILGSTFMDEQKSEESSGPNLDSISWTKPRKGAFGIGVSKETEVKFTRLRARVLR